MPGQKKKQQQGAGRGPSQQTKYEYMLYSPHDTSFLFFQIEGKASTREERIGDLWNMATYCTRLGAIVKWYRKSAQDEEPVLYVKVRDANREKKRMHEQAWWYHLRASMLTSARTPILDFPPDSFELSPPPPPAPRPTIRSERVRKRALREQEQEEGKDPTHG